MPLSCACYPGCWADHSKDWPSLAIPPALIDVERQRLVHYPEVAATTKLVNAASIPYGSYVAALGDVLRVENSAYLAQLVDAVNAATVGSLPLTFARVREAQLARSERWHKGKPWSGDRYLIATVGEIGEMANAIKKLWRIEDEIDNRSADPARQLNTREEVMEYVRKEAADALLYFDLACAKYGIDLGEAVREVFNAKSEELGFPERL